MGGRGTTFLLFSLLLLGCAQSTVELFDAGFSGVDIPEGPDASDATDESASDAASAPGAHDAGPQPGSCRGGTCPEPDPNDAGGHASDAQAPDAGSPWESPDAGTEEPEGQGEVIRASFRVRQAHAALQLPLATGYRLEVGDTVKFTASGYIWPGLIAQGCNGPEGTSGTHTGSAWPLQGGPDFALVAYINDQWTFVGKERSFAVTEAGNLYLGTNDNDNLTGDDCTTVPESQQGFTVHMELTRKK